MKKVTANAVRRVTNDLDKLATTLEKHHERLGIPEKVAKDFSYRCDLLADRIAKVAGFDPSTIGKVVPGPQVKDADEPFMNGHFTQVEKEQLLAKQEAGKLSDGVADPPVDGTQVAKTAKELVVVAAKLATLLGGKSAGELPPWLKKDDDKADKAENKKEDKAEDKKDAGKKAGEDKEEPKPEPEEKKEASKKSETDDDAEYDLDE